MTDVKVLFHVSDNESWPRALINIVNFLKDVDEKTARIEVVANAAAVTSYFDGSPQLMEEMQALSARGVCFAACRNAMAAHALDEGMLPPFVRGVPGGITEIVLKQSMGYAYIKP